MEMDLPEIDTPLATVKYTAAGWIEVRFKAGLVFTLDGISRMMQARQKLGDLGRHRILMILPEEVVDFDLPTVSTDHYKNFPQPNTEAVSWVAWTAQNQQILRLYEAYWPTPFPVQVFLTEPEARAWLESVQPLV